MHCHAPVRELALMPDISFPIARFASAGWPTFAATLWMSREPPLPPDSDNEAPPDCPPRMESGRARLLWIDDEIRPDDAVVRLLEMEGFQVDCTASGLTGLAMAQRMMTYAGIILDLRLPDISGLTVLEGLTRQQLPAPILLLTGYPDFDVAVQAMRLGAWDCQSKTILLSDKWLGLVRALTEHGNEMQNSGTGLLSAHGAIVRELLEFLDELQKRSEGPHRAAEDAQQELEQLTLRVLHTLSDRRVNVFLFLVCGKALKRTLSARADALPSLLSEISTLLKRAAAVDAVMPDRRVQATLSKLAESETRVGKSREEEIARTLGVNRAHLGRLLREATGFTFKQWRWGFLLRPALILLAKSQERVAQIAYSCGYESSAQFDRDFRRMLRMTPTEYRQLVHKNVE